MKTFRCQRAIATVLLGGMIGLFDFATLSNAATQGSPGTTSTGTVTINASIAARVDISSLTDITFTDAVLGPIVGTASSASMAENACVWSNNANRAYFITATGSGTASAFTLAGGTNPAIPYSVAWNQSSGQTTGTALVSNTKSSQFVTTAVNPSCSGGTSASLIVSIAGADAATMIAGSAYAGTLTLLVTPN